MKVAADQSDIALAPATVGELAEAVRSTAHLIPVGAGTKPRLSRVPGVTRLSMLGLSGITEYEPSEFTFTALGGTPLHEIVAALAARGQYLPFEPMLVDAGATLGGTVAAGLSGPGRFRYGGVRDFILGVRFVDGQGRLLRMGGKVVKNAAGFDLPKFFVGSLGRFGVLAEITFKVFPRPKSALTLRLRAESAEQMAKILTEAAASRFEFEALDVEPNGKNVLARLAGPEAALELLGREALSRWPGEIMAGDAAETKWRELREFRWVDPTRMLVKVPTTPGRLGALVDSFSQTVRCHISAGGNVAYVAVGDDESEGFGELLRGIGHCGIVLRHPKSGADMPHSKAFGFGGGAPLWLGNRVRPEIENAVKGVLDPMGRFPAIDE